MIRPIRPDDPVDKAVDLALNAAQQADPRGADLNHQARIMFFECLTHLDSTPEQEQELGPIIDAFAAYVAQIAQEMLDLTELAASVRALKSLTAARVKAAGVPRNHFQAVKGIFPHELDLPAMRARLQWNIDQLTRED